jgi:hypothetical protein
LKKQKLIIRSRKLPGIGRKRGNLDQRESRELGTLYQTSSGVHPYSESRVRKVVYQGVTVGKQELKTVQSSK